ncbi:hypothetical protein [Embleya sp. AB8]|uniref:hypothetical protein n=1 Tax=Embleya sp. AB8 TaxID=3156304 RepID=UPI003C716DF7
MTEEHVRLREALTAELDRIEVHEPAWEAVVESGRRTRRRRRVTVGALVGLCLIAGPAVRWAWAPDADRSTTMVSAGVAPPGAPGDLAGQGTIDDHLWSIRVTRQPNGEECARGELDGRPGGFACGSAPQVLVGDPVQGIGHLNYGSGPIGNPYGSVFGVASDQVTVVVLRLADGTEFRATPVEVGAAHRYFAFVYKGDPRFTLIAYDAQGRQLARGARK